MCTGQPAIAIELVVVEAELTHKLRTLRTSAFQSRADVENHQSIVPVSEIREAILYVDIVNVSPGYCFPFVCADGCSKRILSLPARYFFRVLDVREIDHAQRAGRVIGEVNVVLVDKRTMNAAGDGCRVFRNQFWMCWIGRVVE